MATMLSPTTQPLLLEGVSWDTYTCLLADFADSPAARLAYDQGSLEIMSPSFAHERLKSLLTDLVVALATGMDLDFEQAGSTTFTRADLGRGFEPDASFYIQHVEAVRGHTTIDLLRDPPPDLVIEIDITHPSLNKLPIYATIGVSEIWRYDGDSFFIYRCSSGHYETMDTSTVLQGIRQGDVLQWLEQSRHLSRTAWIRQIQAWGQERAQGQ